MNQSKQMTEAIDIIVKLASSCASIKREQMWDAATCLFNSFDDSEDIKNYLRKYMNNDQTFPFDDDFLLPSLITQYVNSISEDHARHWIHISLGAIVIQQVLKSINNNHNDSSVIASIESVLGLSIQSLSEQYGASIPELGFEAISDLICRLLFQLKVKADTLRITVTTITKSFTQTRIQNMKNCLRTFHITNDDQMDCSFILSLRIISDLLTYSSSTIESEHIISSLVMHTLQTSLNEDIKTILLKSDPNTRRLVISKLFPPLLSSSIKSNQSDLLSETLVALTISLWESSNKTDLSNSLLILCIILSQPIDLLPALCSNARSETEVSVIWSIVQTGILHSDILYRKRSLFILQTMLRHPAASADKISFTYWTDFIEIFSIVEGCNAVHLVEQVLPRYDRLFLYVATESTTTTSTTPTTATTTITVSQPLSLSPSSTHAILDSSILPISARSYQNKSLYFPTLTFNWTKATLHCLLHLPTLNVRRIALHRLFTGKIALAPTKASIYWICEELLGSLIDNVSYFSSYYLDNSQQLGCIEVISEVTNRFTSSKQFNIKGEFVMIGGKDSKGEYSNAHNVLTKSRLNPETYPGIMLPLFIAQVVSVYLHVDDLSGNSSTFGLTAVCIRALVNIICRSDGMKSLSAANWVMRTFSELMVLRDIPRCLGRTELEEIKSFLNGRLASSNGLIREQILYGFLPLIIRCSVLSYSDDLTSTHIGLRDAYVRNLLYIVFDIVGMSVLVQNQVAIQILSETTNKVFIELLNSTTNQSQSDAFMSIYTSPSDLKLIAMSTVIVPMRSSSDCRWVIASNILQNAAIMYQSVYMSHSQILGIISYFDGLLSTAIVKSKFISFNLSALPSELLTSLSTIASDISRYLSTILKSILTQIASSGNRVLISVDQNIIQSISTLVMFMTVLVRLLRIPNLTDTTVVTIISEILSVIRCIYTHVNNTDNELSKMCKLTKLVFLHCVSVILCELESVVTSSSSSSSSSSDNTKSSTHILSELKKTAPSVYNDLYSSISSFNSLLLLSDQFTTISNEEVVRCSEEPSDSNLNSDLNISESQFQYHPLVIDMVVNECKSKHGRVAEMYTSDRWTAVYASFTILQTQAQTHTQDYLKLPDYSENAHSYDARKALTNVLNQLEVCSPASVTPLLYCCSIIIKHVTTVATTDIISTTATTASGQKDDNTIDEIIQTCEDVISRCYLAAFNSSERTSSDKIRAFVTVVFNDSVLSYLPIATTKYYFDKLMALGQKNKPHIITAVALQLCSVWLKNPSLLLPMLDQVTYLLLFKEQRIDDHNISDTNYTDDMFNRESTTQLMQLLDYTVSAARIMTLTVLEYTIQRKTLSIPVVDIEDEPIKNSSSISYISPDIQSDQSTSALAQDLIRKLFYLNFTPRFTSPAMIGTEPFGEKLRCWQALCVLAPAINPSFGEEIISDYMKILDDSCVHTIRVHMEIFGAALCRQAPLVMLPSLLSELAIFTHSQQKSASLFVILGQLYADTDNLNKMESTLSSRSEFYTESTYRNICHLLMAWMSCSNGLPRQLAQMIINILVPRLSEYKHNHEDIPLSSEKLILVNIQKYLNSNKDSMKTIQRQKEFYAKYALEDRCSLRGLLSLQAEYTDVTGEIVPPHLLSVIEAFVKAEFATETQIQSSAIKSVKQVNSNTTTTTTTTNTTSNMVTGSHDNNSRNNDTHHDFESIRSPTQIKRLPFDDLQLCIDERVLNRQQNQAGRKRQELIVCASLIDKPVNLAGIARTCEIFAVNTLVVPSMSIVRTDAFQGIAVSSENWLPMKAIAESELLMYLRSMRKQGYCIVALEQSDSSKSLADPNNFIPERSVLLLGKEKEGIPVEYLCEVDVCIEIPQFGVTRSLNVHVSAALFIWEAIRKNPKFNLLL